MIIPENIKAIICDYDGVLGDSTPFNTYACKEAAKLCGIELEDDVYQRCAPGGATIQDIAQCIVSYYGKPELANEYIGYKKSFDGQYAKEVTIFPNVAQCLELLSSKYPLAVNTGTREVLLKSVLSRYNLAKYFKIIVTAENIAKGKPDPESYLLASKQLGISPENCLVVEDGESGVMSALRAGCYVIGIANSLTSKQLLGFGCNQVISNLSELMAPTGV